MYEYKILKAVMKGSLTARLNEEGCEGWRVVTLDDRGQTFWVLLERLKS